MLTIVQQTHKQKVKMYMKSKKKELAKMLANRDMYEDAPPRASVTLPNFMGIGGNQGG